MKTFIRKHILLLLVATSIIAPNAFAAGYIKIPDIDGESRYAKIEVQQGQLLLVGEDGRKTRLQKDGTYRTRDNQVFVVKNGLVQGPRAATTQKIGQQEEPKPKPGQNIQSNQSGENAALLLPAVQQVRE